MQTVPTLTTDGVRRPDLPPDTSYTVVADHGPTMDVEVDGPDPRLDAFSVAARLAVTERLDDLDDETVAQVAVLYPEWRQPEGAHDAYPEGAIVRHDGTLWRPTTGANVWAPGVSGWHRYGASLDAGPLPWVQPTGGHDAYPAGAKVTHDGQTWVNSHGDGNVWAPGSYGWSDRLSR